MFLTVKDSASNYHTIATHTDLIKAITGCPKRTATAIAKLLTLRGFNEIPILDLQELGLSESQYKKLKAAAEFGKRDYLRIARISSENVDNPAIAARHFQDLIGAAHVEMGAILVLDVKHHIIHKEVFAVGADTECIFSARQVFEIVLRHRGARFMVAHNHPSGAPRSA